MPNKLTTDQIKDIINDKASEQTILALKEHLAAQLKRREKFGQTVRKPRKYDGDEKERRRQINAEYYKKKLIK